MTPESAHKMFIARPVNTNKYHIFKEDNRSLCNRWALLFPNKDNCTDFLGTEKFDKRYDCKSCFKKTGIEVKDA